MLDSASDLKDLLAPAGNRLEKLKGDRAGQYSIRIKISGGSVLCGGTTGLMKSRSRIITEGR